MYFYSLNCHLQATEPGQNIKSNLILYFNFNSPCTKKKTEKLALIIALNYVRMQYLHPT